jgi:putative NADPH-quinone reductase
MSRATIFLCNPRPASLSYRFCEIVRQEIASRGVEAKVIDIYRERIDPVLTSQQAETYEDGVVYPDVSEIMNSFRTSSALCFVFPVWMYGVPSPLKGLLEKIVRPSITFRIIQDGVEPLLTNVTRLCVICSSGQADDFGARDRDPVEYAFRKLKEDNFGADCAYEYLRLFGADHINVHEIEQFEQRIRSRVTALFDASH